MRGRLGHVAQVYFRVLYFLPKRKMRNFYTEVNFVNKQTRIETNEQRISDALIQKASGGGREVWADEPMDVLCIRRRRRTLLIYFLGDHTL